MAGPIRGGTVHLRALRLLVRHPELRRYVIVPIAVTLVAGAVVYGTLLRVGLPVIDRAVGGAGLAGVLQVLLSAAALLAVAFVMVRFGVVLGSPWYSRMSERIEELVTGDAPPAQPLTARGIRRDLGRAVRFEAAKLAVVLPVGGMLLLANVVPVLGQGVATAGGVALAAFVACLDFLDGPLERRGRSFREKLRYLRQQLPGTATFGLVCVPLLAVPVVNLLSIPLCVAAGTLLYCEGVPPEETARLG